MREKQFISAIVIFSTLCMAFIIVEIGQSDHNLKYVYRSTEYDSTELIVDSMKYFNMGVATMDGVYDTLVTTVLDSSVCINDYFHELNVLDSYYVLKDFNTSNYCLVVYDKYGEYQSNIDLSNELDNVEGQYVWTVDYSKDEIYIASSEKSKVWTYDLQGSLLSTKNLPFNLTNIYTTTDEASFIIFSPMAVHGNKGAIIVTDTTFEVESRYYSLPDVTWDLNVLTSKSIKKFGDNIYFNPPLTSDIYRISDDGTSLNKIYDGREVSDSLENHLENNVSFYQDSFFALQKIMPIIDYFVTDELIMYRKYIDNLYQTVVVERSTGKSVIHQNGIPVEHYKGSFNMAFQHTRDVSRDQKYLLNWYDPNEYNDIVNFAQNNNFTADYTDLPTNINTPIVLKYDYNFDSLYSKSIVSPAY